MMAISRPSTTKSDREWTRPLEWKFYEKARRGSAESKNGRELTATRGLVILPIRLSVYLLL